LNLSAKRLLFPGDAEKAQNEDYIGPGNGKINDNDWKQWCKFGPVGKYKPRSLKLFIYVNIAVH